MYVSMDAFNSNTHNGKNSGNDNNSNNINDDSDSNINSTIGNHSIGNTSQKHVVICAWMHLPTTTTASMATQMASTDNSNEHLPNAPVPAEKLNPTPSLGTRSPWTNAIFALLTFF